MKKSSNKITLFPLNQALHLLICGNFIARIGWKEYYLCKTNDEGELLICDPKRYGYRVYVPKIEDLLAEDWYMIK